MFEERNLKQDLSALALAALAIFCVLSLTTRNPADPVGEMLWPVSLVYQTDVSVYPQQSHVDNLCGRLGATFSDMAFMSMGWGAYYMTVSLVVVAVLMLMRRQITTPSLRLCGWLISLAGLTSVLSLLPGGWLPSPAIGAGGYLGALGSGLLLGHFAAVGAGILSLTMLAGGLLLCTDYVILQIAAAVGLPVARGVARGVHTQWEKRRERRAARLAAKAEKVGKMKATDLDDVNVGANVGKPKKAAVAAETVGEEEDDANSQAANDGPRVTFLGRNSKDDVADEDVEEEDEAAELEDETDDEEEAAVAEVDSEEEEVEEEVAAAVPAPKFLNRGKSRKKRKSKDEEREEVMHHLDAAAADMADAEDYELPPLDLLLEGDDVTYEAQEKEVLRKAKILEETFRNFGFNVKVVEIETGPVIAQYEIELEAGLRLAKITNLADDLAIALRVPSVRIVAPIPGKNTVGIEVPNTNRQMVRLRDVMQECGGRVKKMAVPIYLGKDVSGHPMVEDLARMPHLLIAGRTGTGKSVCLNAIISSMLMTRRPDEVRMLMIDPKMVELSGYGTLPHLMHPVVTDMRKAEAILAWAVEKMEERYSLLAKAGVRQISSYNQLGEEELFERMGAETEEDREAIPQHLPYIVIVADEIADMMMVAGKEVEQHIIRLAQKSRAVGIHLILATQKPTVDVITGLIKSNLPARISFQVASRTDSRVVLDEMGAEKLLGDGDMLFLKPGTSQLHRGQGTYLSDDEIDTVVSFVSTGEQNFVQELVQLKPKADGEGGGLEEMRKRDELYESAIDLVVREQRGSVSLLQRSLGIGYGRGARLIDFMAEDGIVGQYAGSQAREVLLSLEEWEAMQGGEAGAETTDVASLAADVASAEESVAKKKERPKPKKKAKAEAVSATPRPRTNKIIPVPDWDDDEDELEDSAEDDEYEDDAGEDEQYDEEECEEEYEEEEVA